MRKNDEKEWRERIDPFIILPICIRMKTFCDYDPVLTDVINGLVYFSIVALVVMGYALYTDLRRTRANHIRSKQEDHVV